jgi:serine/threonine-protein kinase TTK/MPS1
VEAVETSGEPAKSETSAKEAPVKEALVRSTKSKGELLKPLDPTKLVPTAVTNKPDDGVPGIMSKPKRVSFIAAEAEVEAVPIPSAGVTTTSTASVTKDVRTESITALPPPAPVAHSQPHTQQSQLQPHTGTGPTAPSCWGILGDANRYVEMNGRHYLRLNVLGKGGSSCVYRIIGAEDGQVYAYKRVEVKDSEDVDAVFDSYANEIALLRKLSSVGNHSAEGKGICALV